MTSINPQIKRLDNLAPLRKLALHKCIQLLRCAADRLCTHEAKLLINIRQPDDARQFLIECGNDGLRCARWRMYRVPGACIEIRESGLCERRHLGEIRPAPLTGDSKAPHLS